MMETVDLINLCRLYEDLVQPEIDQYKLPLTGVNSATDVKSIYQLFKQHYASVVQVDLEKDSKDNLYGVVIFNDRDQYFHAMQTMFFNLDGSLLMAISVLDEVSQKDGLSRVLKIQLEGQDKGPYFPKNQDNYDDEATGPSNQQFSKFIPQGPNFNSSTGQLRQIFEVMEFPDKEKKEDSPKGLDGSDEWEDGTEEMYDHNYRKYLKQMEVLDEDDEVGSNLYYEDEEEEDFEEGESLRPNLEQGSRRRKNSQAQMLGPTMKTPQMGAFKTSGLALIGEKAPISSQNNFSKNNQTIKAQGKKNNSQPNATPQNSMKVVKNQRKVNSNPNSIAFQRGQQSSYNLPQREDFNQGPRSQNQILQNYSQYNNQGITNPHSYNPSFEQQSNGPFYNPSYSRYHYENSNYDPMGSYQSFDQYPFAPEDVYQDEYPVSSKGNFTKGSKKPQLTESKRFERINSTGQRGRKQNNTLKRGTSRQN